MSFLNFDKSYNSKHYFSSDLSISLEKLEEVGCDGTATYTGWKNGVIHQLESHLGRPIPTLEYIPAFIFIFATFSNMLTVKL